MTAIECPICGDNDATCSSSVDSDGASWTWVTWSHYCPHCAYSARKVTQDAYNCEDVDNCQLPDHRPARPQISHGGLDVVHALNRDINKPTDLVRQIQELQSRLRELQVFEERALQSGGAFLSYAHKDSGFVDKLYSRLTEDQIAVWRDIKDLSVGDVIDKAVSEGIQRNWLFIIVLTPNSLQSRWVERELDEASHEEVDGKKVLLPVVAEGLDPANLPPRIRRRYCAVFGEDFDAAYLELRHSIRKHLKHHAAGNLSS